MAHTSIKLISFDYIFYIALVISIISMIWLYIHRNNILLMIFKSITILILTFIIFEPTLIISLKDNLPNLAIAIDVSPSMKISGRTESVDIFLKDKLTELIKNFNTKLYCFATYSKRIEYNNFLDTKCGNSTNIIRSLLEIKKDYGENLGGILLISDGNHNQDNQSIDLLSGFNTPIFTLAPSTNKKIRDIAIKNISIGDFAFKDIPIEVDIEVTSIGLKGEKTKIRIISEKGNGEVVSMKDINIKQDIDNIKLSLKFTPKYCGKFNFMAEVIPLDGEISVENNKRNFSLEVMREKIRILYICGQPNFEYAFLRHILKSDPMVELVSFVILRNPENIPLVPENDLALIPFPVDKLFRKEIYNFDILILENFTYHRYGFTQEYLENIEKWVIKNGGGLIMIAGDNSFGRGGWANTPVARILPVILDTQQDQYFEGLFKPKVSDINHPIMQLEEDIIRNRQVWDELPDLDGCELLKERKDSEVLLRNPWNNSILLACWEQGKGRVIALGTNTTWRWALQSSTPEYYNRFWKNVIRYLAKDLDNKKWRILFNNQQYYSEQPFTIKIINIEQNSNITPIISLTDVEGRNNIVSLSKINKREWIGNGKFTLPGDYRFKLEINDNGINKLYDNVVIKVLPKEKLEEINLDINEAFLKEISEFSQGYYFTQESFNIENIKEKSKISPSINENKRIPLWTSPIIFIILLSGLFIEWFLRKKKGML